MTTFRLTRCPRCTYKGMYADDGDWVCMACGCRVYPNGGPVMVSGRCFLCGGRSLSTTGYVCQTHGRPDHVPSLATKAASGVTSA